MKATTFKFKTAFTLIELMIAIALFSAIMVAVYSNWKSIVSGTRVAEQAASDAQRAHIAIHTIEQALLTAQLYDENNKYYSFIVDTSDEKYTAIQFTARLPATFLASTYFGDEVVRQVTFCVEKDKDDYNKNNLVMTQVPILDVNEQRDPYKIVLARDVTLFQLEFWKQVPGKDTDFTKDFLSTNDLPKLVRVSLGVGHLPHNNSLPDQFVMRLVNIPTDRIRSRF